MAQGLVRDLHGSMMKRLEAPKQGIRLPVTHLTRCHASACPAPMRAGTRVRKSVACPVTATPIPAADAGAAAPVPLLAEIPITSVINTQGMVLPDVPPGTHGAVYAIYDEKQKLQYVGTTQHLRSALRTALGRRPEKTHYYKAHYMTTAEPTALQAVVDQWFEECGGQPNGNRLSIERRMWQQPVDAGAISERGRKGAAEECARQLVAQLKDRGCKEDFTPNPALLLEGQVDFLPARDLSDEEMAAEMEAEAARSRGRRSCVAVVDGIERVFTTAYSLKFPTAGGHMMDVSVLFDGRETHHRVIVGKQYYEPYGISPEAAVEVGLALLLRAKVARSTEGMLLSSQFPVNYFALGQVEQWYGDEFREEFERVTGGAQLGDDTGDTWRFSKIHDYGPLRRETAEQLAVSVGQGMSSPVLEALKAQEAEGQEEQDDELPGGGGILGQIFAMREEELRQYQEEEEQRV